uniref:Uncharacterized protein n=1 Tax=Arundo donax TaxID=35708 RepID=A0A0A9CUH7_ARUDO
MAPNGLALEIGDVSFSESVCSNTASISRTALGISSISPTRYKVALAG